MILGLAQFNFKACYFLVRNQGPSKDWFMPGSSPLSSAPHPGGVVPPLGQAWVFRVPTYGQLWVFTSFLPVLRILKAQLLLQSLFLPCKQMSSDKSSFVGWAYVSGFLSSPRAQPSNSLVVCIFGIFKRCFPNFWPNFLLLSSMENRAELSCLL